MRPRLEDAPTIARCAIGPFLSPSAPSSTTFSETSARVSEDVFLRLFRPDINRDGGQWRGFGKAPHLAAGVREQVAWNADVRRETPKGRCNDVLFRAAEEFLDKLALENGLSRSENQQ
jgi:hypothetical protein